MSARASAGSGGGTKRSIKFTYSVAALVACALGALVLVIWQRWDVYWAWLLSSNVIAFVFYRYDKWRSKHEGGMRVPEVTLLLLSLVGGFAGAALGMYLPEQHKVNKPKFIVALVLGALIQMMIIWILYLR